MKLILINCIHRINFPSLFHDSNSSLRTSRCNYFCFPFLEGK
ncbi:hypothetical protein CY0110_19092 [Crocosphaera chwakensis CCY0110]|uniref:Uncharacterized protein n=1 Tax=Crocosphaera chwakensis CCY0110 TaxID=391612 RepID=A3IJF0_9CHRO|nr:hypothetical protein CY0110_19092 [Crocosphaera chwakensis CCY0110]